MWLTADGVAVLDHDGTVRAGVRRRPIAAVERSRLPPHIPALEDLYRHCGAGFQLSLDVKDPSAAGATVAVARAAGDDALGRLWLCHPDWEELARWRADGMPGLTGAFHRHSKVVLVQLDQLRRLHEGPEHRAATLADHGVDAVNMPATDWNAGLATLFTWFRLPGVRGMPSSIRSLSLLRMGCDAVYSDRVEIVRERNEYRPDTSQTHAKASLIRFFRMGPMKRCPWNCPGCPLP